ncbi:coatomer subunit delta [Mycoemilia scoparia]|uniref:Coatomer subunit delta n=1 Tax=Mycoemilia scoparia TaxID=417184 RepID=A0A9W8AAH0_9FUNG|nr:coatomer subunit delta [Mycoemilia scoparia]
MTLVSRQFVEMPRTRIEGFLASFPRLMTAGQQHTTVETDAIRYVYQPLGEDMYTVLITNRHSNIVQDIDTLHLVARAINDICDILDQDDVLNNAFELLSAFDEIISLGYRENIDIQKLRTIMEMESHEEKIQEIIQKNKEREAKQELKRKAKLFDEQRKEALKRGISGQSFGGGISSGMGGMSSSLSSGYESVPTRDPMPTSYSSYSASSAAKSKPDSTSKARGMKLGQKPKAPAMFEHTPDPTDALEEMTNDLSLADEVEETAVPTVVTKDVHISIEESVTATINRDGGLEELEVKGDLFLTIKNEENNKSQVKVALPDNIKPQFKTHPNIDKKLFTQNNLLTLKERARPLPLGQPAGILKWRFVSQDEEDIPLSINCWPEPSATPGRYTVNIEYEKTEKTASHLELKNVIIAIPIPRGGHPEVEDIAKGSYEVKPGAIHWKIPVIDDGDSTGSMEFSIQAGSDDTFFPINVSFESDKPLCNVQIEKVSFTGGDDDVDYSQFVQMKTDEYRVV